MERSEELYEEVCELLHRGHRKNLDTPERTLSRLFRKHMEWRGVPIPPGMVLSIANTTVALETWSKAAIRGLPRRERKPGRNPKRSDVPVVILRFRGRDWLIDGGTRAHVWEEAGDVGDHPAYVVTVSDC